ncbi:uncharacterized protein [Arachis hypogaea]|uniref:uncharacterized protein n=1 Tax=Arachis hypogaea TaxID=3818 RepID=UPI003B220D45
MQEMFSMYIETRALISVIELYVELEQSEADRNIGRKDYNSDNEEEFESNYEVVAPDEENVKVTGRWLRMWQTLQMHLQTNIRLRSRLSCGIPMVADGEFAVGMEFSSREVIIMAMKDYTIRRGVDYRVYESEPLTFYAKCTQYGSGCNWLISVSMISRKYCWVIRRYNGSHTCTRATISQDHSKLDSNSIAEAIKPLVEADPSIKDGNNNIVPIAFTIVEGEASDAWHIFLSNLRQHVVTRDGVGLIYDRHESINAVVARSNGAWSSLRAFHMFCIRHLESNFLRKFKAPYLQKLVVNIGYSRTVREYEMRYQHLRERGEAYTNWLNRIPREQYALAAFDGGYQWGHMTTNLVECINSVLKDARNFPITALVKAMFYRFNELFTRKRAEAESRITAGHVFSEVVTAKLHANQLASGNIQVNCFDRMNVVFEVREMPSGTEYAVDLRRQRCDYGEFQRLDWRVYVHGIYKMDQVRRVYRARFRPLGNPTTWPAYNGPRFVSNPYLRRVTKGHPRMTRFLNEMDTRMLRGPR